MAQNIFLCDGLLSSLGNAPLFRLAYREKGFRVEDLGFRVCMARGW